MSNFRRLQMELLEPRQLLAVTTLTPSDDTYLRDGTNNGTTGVLDSRYSFVPYIKFDLSELSIDQITSATLTVTKVASARNENASAGRFAVYGLNDVAGNTAQNWSEQSLVAGTNSGSEWTGDSSTNGIDRSRLTSLDAEDGAAVTETITSGTDVPLTLTGTDLVAFLNERVDDDGFVTFVIPFEEDGGKGYGLASKENATAAFAPQLEITYDEQQSITYAKQIEDLNRGLVALRSSTSTAYLSWRLLADDPTGVSFNVYRTSGRSTTVKLNSSPITDTTTFVDTTATATSSYTYFVRAVVGGVEQPASETYTLSSSVGVQQHIDIPLSIPADGVTPAGEAYTYSANDATVGDLDGDGQYEIIVKWDPSNAKDSSQTGYTGNVYVDAYSLEGNLLWRIDLGQNIRAGAHYTQMLVFDFDGDGRSEVVLKTAPGTIDGQGNAVLMTGDSVTDDYRESSGRILTGPEYLTVFDGYTGAELQTIDFPLERGSITSWGDNYGNRAARFLAGVAYLDGEHPSIIWARGYYGPQSGYTSRNEIVALDWQGGELSQVWRFNALSNGQNSEYIAQGAHSMAIADVDGDGFDEVIYGAAVIDHDGTGLYSTGLGHGDALHVSDMDPSNPGLEIYMVHESVSAYQSDGRDAGGEIHDAATGTLLQQIPSNNDVGRGVAGDIDPNYEGFEYWATTDEGTRYIYNVSGEALYATPSNMMYNFLVWWDGDLSRELLDGTTVSEWNNPGRSNLLSYGNNSYNNTGHLAANNGSKNTPSLVADILGDWREEIIWRRSDNSALEIWVSTASTDTRLTTLMHDVMYRESVAGQNVGYNQPSHTSYWIGEGMDTPTQQLVYYAGRLEGDYNNDGVVDLVDFTEWRNHLGQTGIQAADGDHNGVVDANDYLVWKNNFGAVATPSTLTATAAGSVAATQSSAEAEATQGAASSVATVAVAATGDSQASTSSRSTTPDDSSSSNNDNGNATATPATLLAPRHRSPRHDFTPEVRKTRHDTPTQPAATFVAKLDAAFETWGLG